MLVLVLLMHMVMMHMHGTVSVCARGAHRKFSLLGRVWSAGAIGPFHLVVLANKDDLGTL
jgi:hypothetical protein